MKTAEESAAVAGATATAAESQQNRADSGTVETRKTVIEHHAAGKPRGSGGTGAVIVLNKRKVSKAIAKAYARNNKIVTDGVRDLYNMSIIVGEALLEIYNDKLYLAAGYNTFADYSEGEHSIGKSYAFSLKAVAELRQRFSAMAESMRLPENERQARPLLGLKNLDSQLTAWKTALTEAGDRPITESHVRKAVEALQKGGSGAGQNSGAQQGDAGETWKSGVLAKLKECGYVEVFEQPFPWAAGEAVDLVAANGGRFVKVIDELTLDQAVCATRLKEKHPGSLIIINADSNAQGTFKYSASGAEIEKGFSPGFNVMAKQLGAFLEGEGDFYRAGELNERGDMLWHEIPEPDLATLGLSTPVAITAPSAE